MRRKYFKTFITLFILLLFSNAVANEEIIIRLIPTTRKNCANTNWTPSQSNYCNTEEFEQTSNCGDKRTVFGTKQPTEWTPSVANKRQCEITTQSNSCTTRQKQGELPDIWTPDANTVWETKTFTQTNTCSQTRQTQGTKPNIITNIFKQIGTQCCNFSTKWGWSNCGNCYYNATPNTKTYGNTYPNYTIWATYTAGNIHPSGAPLTYTDIKITCADGKIFYVSGSETCGVDISGAKGGCFLKLNQPFTCPP